MHASFITRLFERFQSQDARLAKLSYEEKRSVLTLMHSVAIVDGELSSGEADELKELGLKLGVKISERLGLPEAMVILAANPNVLKLASLVVADAFFADGDYDDAEQKFVTTFAERFKLPENPLRDAVESLRKHKLDDALREWNHEIKTMPLG
ncbi:MAG: hypothetical protein Q8O67_15835 [Deltaproteobacteria bacterium]|nr:hypothetical protein [Deltaproteobacteria bacterium]